MRFIIDYAAVLMALGALLLVSGCCCITFNAPSPKYTCEAETLFIDPSAFPSGWSADLPFEISGPVVGKGEGKQRMARTFYGHTTIANQTIYCYENESAASKAFERWLGRRFNSKGFILPWETPADLQELQSPHADQFYIACATNVNYHVCQMLGQYEEYVIRLYVPMTPRTNVTYTDFETILRAAEKQIASRLESEPHEP